MKLLAVVNPISGGVDKNPFIKKAVTLCENYGLDLKIFKTTGQDDEAHLKAELKTFNPDKVVSVGGDGTTLFTAKALLNTNICMGIIPLGSANGMAVELGVSEDPLQAFKDIIMSNIITDLDLVCVNKEHYSIHIGDVGINANIVEGYDKDTSRGMTTYIKHFIEALNKVDPFQVNIACNQKVYHKKVVMLGLCNGRKYGTGVPLNKEGNPMDGRFEIVLIEKINANLLIKAGLSSINEAFIDNENNTVISTSHAKITFNEPRLLQLDGEVIGTFKTLDVSLLKGAVKFITTQQNVYV
ncbi:diacylglycerol kinase [Formosa sediminum]|uniref:Diacylglycerol kinase n=1 Tax=Formosa sediminum TaxID=2594004 RepID=A0A516GM64_9FLAO|nr:diacylglycerol kinase family protein [Formosa sediminum]QDO92597.1 diacylglycerol kinase [Formosa sediminum]